MVVFCKMKVGIGQDSHRFDFLNKNKKLVLGGVVFEGYPPLEGNSDADVILHSLTNAISGITCVNILGEVSDKMCLGQGITDSSAYLKKSLEYLGQNKIVHVSISIECKLPKISPKIPEMRNSISKLLDIPDNCIGITATTGEDLTEFGLGKGIQVFSCVTAT
jgi:2-C-methyl-D-erythritol 2,4-cyclodiphosphate synthase